MSLPDDELDTNDKTVPANSVTDSQRPKTDSKPDEAEAQDAEAEALVQTQATAAEATSEAQARAEEITIARALAAGDARTAVGIQTAIEAQAAVEAQATPEAQAAAQAQASAEARVAAEAQAAAQAREQTAPAVHPTSGKQKLLLFLLLAVLSALVLWQARNAVSRVDSFIQRETRVYWPAPADFTLSSGPPTFWYDSAHSQLVCSGVVDQKQKLELVGLGTAAKEETRNAELKSYSGAIDQLAFASNQQMAGLLLSLLVLGGLAGVLGVQLRSLVNFVGKACYQNNLDLVIWWPYYAIRPLIGLLVGIVVVVIVHAGFFVAGNGAPSGTLWWAGIAFLAGFGEQEFTSRLRQLTKTLFGGS